MLHSYKVVFTLLKGINDLLWLNLLLLNIVLVPLRRWM